MHASANRCKSAGVLCSCWRFGSRGRNGGGRDLQGDAEFLEDFATELIGKAFGGGFGAVFGEGVEAEFLFKAAGGGCGLGVMAEAVDECEDFFRPGFEHSVDLGGIEAVDGFDVLENDLVHGGAVQAGVGFLGGRGGGPLELAVEGGLAFVVLKPVLISGVAPAGEVIVLEVVALFAEPIEDTGVFDIGVERFVDVSADMFGQTRDD